MEKKARTASSYHVKLSRKGHSKLSDRRVLVLVTSWQMGICEKGKLLWDMNDDRGIVLNAKTVMFPVKSYVWKRFLKRLQSLLSR